MKKSKLAELKKELSALTKEQQKAVTGGAIFNYGSGCQDGAGGAYKPNCYGPSGSYCQCW